MSSKLPDMKKLMKEIEEEQKDSLFIFNSGMDTYKNWLKAHNITDFQVDYSGYGDDGEVSDFSINFTKDGNTKDSIPPDYLSFERKDIVEDLKRVLVGEIIRTNPRGRLKRYFQI